MLIEIEKNNKIKLIEAFSDTHGRHRELCHLSESADMIICAGDVCYLERETQLRDFFTWFAEQPAKHKIFVPGNNDSPYDHKYIKQFIPDNIIYIENGRITIDDINFYILPVRTRLDNKMLLPTNVDILITHAPPFGILDSMLGYYNRGCKTLLEMVNESQPRIHIFGHCHEHGGEKITIGKTTFYNVALYNKKRTSYNS